MEHARAYTASETAGAQHVPGEQMIKAVVVKSNGNYMMCVLPAIHMIDFDKLKKPLGTMMFLLLQRTKFAPSSPMRRQAQNPHLGTSTTSPHFWIKRSKAIVMWSSMQEHTQIL